MIIYISGPMTGYENINAEMFKVANDHLTKMGYQVLDPTRQPAGLSWEEYMHYGIDDVLSAGGVATLPDWQESRGAALEVYVAQQLKKVVKPWFQWHQSPDDVRYHNPPVPRPDEWN